MFMFSCNILHVKVISDQDKLSFERAFDQRDKVNSSKKSVLNAFAFTYRFIKMFQLLKIIIKKWQSKKLDKYINTIKMFKVWRLSKQNIIATTKTIKFKVKNFVNNCFIKDEMFCTLETLLN